MLTEWNLTWNFCGQNYTLGPERCLCSTTHTLKQIKQHVGEADTAVYLTYSIALRKYSYTQYSQKPGVVIMPLRWRHNGRDGVSNHQPHHCLLNRLFRRKSKKTPKLRVIGLCARIHREPVNCPHKWPVTRKMFPFHDVIIPILSFRRYHVMT